MCDICGRGSCCESFHSLEEQQRYEKVIEAFDRARELRQQVRDEIDEEAREIEAAERRAEHETDIVFRLRHPYCEDMTTLLRDAVNEILSLRIIASNHRDGRLAALEELAKHQGPALDVDVWPNVELRGRAAGEGPVERSGTNLSAGLGGADIGDSK